MKKTTFFCILIFSIKIQAQDIQSLKSLDSPATKLDVLISSLYGQLGCKVKFSVWPVEPLSKRKPELCMNDIDYLLNIETLRIGFVVSENHHLVNGFDELEEKNKLEAISGIAIRMEPKIKNIIRETYLLIGSYPIKIEFHISHKGYMALRNNKGEIKSIKYEVKKF